MSEGMTIGRIYHVAQSVDADRFTDAYLRKRVLPGVLVDGRQPTVAEFRRACAEARASGLRVFPPCDNVKPDGSCAGHEKEPTP